LTAIQKFRIAVNTGDESVLGIEGTLPLSAKEAPSADFDDFEGLDNDPCDETSIHLGRRVLGRI
jgi:uncharacterized protein (DUF39 family)